MSAKIKHFISKLHLGVLAVAFTTLSIQLFPISRHASSWNRFLRKTSETLSQVNTVKKMNEDSKDVLTVMICNGDVFETKFKTNN
ncbi:hypothetical protein [Prochlorococcus marinus]|uniref:hypothetical protein n=1 Tax=Prochlorococcus marinus TaxID=1219 RepID=UPI0022B2F71A|nr:hypothetical protein [Prochlorococcus marinus]